VPNFAVRIPLRTEFAPSAESVAWLEILGVRLGSPSLASECHIFVRAARGSVPGELVVIHRELRPDDLGFVLTPSDDYPYGNYLGEEAEDRAAAEFVAAIESPAGTVFTLSDLVRAGIR